MTDAQFTALSAGILTSIREVTPWDTGNLAKNATKIRSVGAGKFEIYVDRKIAPYFDYVNGLARINNRPNRNHGYFADAIQHAMSVAARNYGGTLVHD